jgi:hypothetical protein
MPDDNDPDFGTVRREEMGEPVIFRGPQFGISEDALRNAVNMACTCGGNPPGPDACPACVVWHHLKS